MKHITITSIKLMPDVLNNFIKSLLLYINLHKPFVFVLYGNRTAVFWYDSESTKTSHSTCTLSRLSAIAVSNTSSSDFDQTDGTPSARQNPAKRSVA